MLKMQSISKDSDYGCLDGSSTGKAPIQSSNDVIDFYAQMSEARDFENAEMKLFLNRQVPVSKGKSPQN